MGKQKAAFVTRVGQPWMEGKPKGGFQGVELPCGQRCPGLPSSLAAPSREPGKRAGDICGLSFSLLSDLGEQRRQEREGAFLL